MNGEAREKDTLHILWVNADPVTVKLMIFMYAINSLRKGWWKHVHILVWGAAAKLLAEDEAVREKLREFQAAGGDVSACRRCAEELGVVEALEKLDGVEVFYVGQHFTKLLKDNEHLITV